MGLTLSSYDSEEKHFRKYGWKVDTPDQRDHKYKLKKEYLYSEVDLRSKCPGIYNQGKLGSCIALLMQLPHMNSMKLKKMNVIFLFHLDYLYTIMKEKLKIQLITIQEQT